MEYKRLTNQKWSKEIDLTQELGYSHIYQRLYNLESKIENGTLIELPCKVGDTVYKVLSYSEIVEFVVMQINTITTHDAEGITFLVFDGKSEPTIGIIGLDVFVTKEQAEAKLKALKSKE